MAYVANHGFAQNGLVATAKAMIEDIKVRRARRAAYYKTYNELAQLTDRELADIGIARSNIDRIAYEHAYGA